MTTTIESPFRRYAIRARYESAELWLTDDETGCDEALDFTGWGEEKLVTYVDREDALRNAEAWRKWARARKMTLRVVRVWEYPGGVFEKTKRP